MTLLPYVLVIPEQARSLCLCGYYAGELFWWCNTGEEEKSAKHCSAYLHKAVSAKYFSLKSQAASTAKMLIKPLGRPHCRLFSSLGCHGPRLLSVPCVFRGRWGAFSGYCKAKEMERM